MPILGVQRLFVSISGVERQNHACSGRSAPEPCSVLAFERQTDAPPGCDFSSAVFDSVFNFYIYFVTPHDHEPKKT